MKISTGDRIIFKVGIVTSVIGYVPVDLIREVKVLAFSPNKKYLHVTGSGQRNDGIATEWISLDQVVDVVESAVTVAVESVG